MAFDFTNNPDFFQKFYQRTFLQYLISQNVTFNYGQKSTIPLNSGKTIVWTRMTPLAVSTTPITNVDSPESAAMSDNQVEATLEEYGKPIDLKEFASLTAFSDPIDKATMLLNDHALKTLEMVNLSVLGAGTQIVYAGSVANEEALDGTKTPSKDNVRSIWAALAGKSVPTFTDGNYICLIHPDKILDIFTTDDLLKMLAGKPSVIEMGYSGVFSNVKFIITPNAPKTVNATSGKTVYKTIFFGPDAYGTVDLNGKSYELGFSNVDKMQRTKTVYWKGKHACARLDDDRIIVLKSN
jgi:N4-gp56 family major capsid protein